MCHASGTAYHTPYTLLYVNHLVASLHALGVTDHEHTHFADEETEAQLGEGLACPTAWAHRDDNILTNKLHKSGPDLTETGLLATPSTA